MKPPLTRTQAALLYVAGWLPLFVLYTIGLRQTAAPNYPMAVLYSVTYLLPGVAGGAVVWWAAGRIPWRRLNWPGFAGIELGLDLGYLVAWHMVFYTWLWLSAGRDVTRTVISQALAWQLVMALFIVAIHSALFHASRIFGELRAKELAAVEAEALRVRAEMQALRGQLNPHFLFNSLHSITALVRDDPRRAEDALLQFAALLRRVLAVKRDSTDEVSLADEMKFVDDYLAIERLRLGERLRLTCEISDEARACRLPAFSVQPLVENAVGHAIAPRRDGGHVTIRAAVRDGQLNVLVHDDGPGADPAAVASAAGVGLGVVRQRLRLRHGERASLAIDTAPGKGFSATLSLPADSGEPEGGDA